MKVCPHCRTMYGPDVIVCPNDGARLDEESTQRDPLVGQVLAERYRIIRTLGEGGMGRVYLGEHVRMGRASAIKVMHPSLAPTADAIGRFNREAANASRINHPHVAAIYDFGETADGTMYLAMEYVEGETLASLLKREGSLALERVATLTTQIASALEAAHKLGIVHRDLKPDNILVTRSEHDSDFAKVVDFGIAKSMGRAGQTVTMAGISVGTPEFMSPEQLAGGELDQRSDIYSLALVVYAMLTGRLPYPEPSSKDALIERLTAHPKSLATVAPARQWPDALQAALNKALSPDASSRYESVTRFASDLAAAAIGTASTRRMTPLVSRAVEEPVEPAPTPQRSRRSPILAALALVVIAAAAFAARGIFRTSTPPVTADTAHVAHDTSAVRVAASPTVPPAAPESARALALPAPSDSAPTAKTVKSATHDSTRRAAPVSSPAPSALAAGLASAPKVGAASASDQAPPVTALDTITSAPASANDAAIRRAGRHNWLKASGDSSAQPNAALTPVQAEAREVLGHMARANNFFNNHQPGKAIPEVHLAFEEYGMFVTDHPGAQQTRFIGNQFQQELPKLMTFCRAASDSSVARGRKAMPCDNVERFATAQIQRGLATADTAGTRRGGRRQQRPATSP